MLFRFSYNIVFFLITYIVPLTLMAACYSRMGAHLWGKKTIGEENETLRQNYQKKKKVTFQIELSTDMLRKLGVISFDIFGL